MINKLINVPLSIVRIKCDNIYETTALIGLTSKPWLVSQRSPRLPASPASPQSWLKHLRGPSSFPLLGSCPVYSHLQASPSEGSWSLGEWWGNHWDLPHLWEHGGGWGWPLPLHPYLSPAPGCLLLWPAWEFLSCLDSAAVTQALLWTECVPTNLICWKFVYPQNSYVEVSKFICWRFSLRWYLKVGLLEDK